MKSLSRKFPYTRSRRLRSNQTIRDLVAENQIQVNKLIQPLFVSDTNKKNIDITTMPGQKLFSKLGLFKEIETLQKISSLIQSCPRLLVTHAKIEKWQKFIDINSLLTPEVVSSFDVLQAEITVLTNQHEKEKKRFIELKNSLEKKNS